MKTTPVLVFVFVQFPNSRMQMKRISQVRLCHCSAVSVLTSFELGVYQTHNFIRLNEKSLPVETFLKGKTGSRSHLTKTRCVRNISVCVFCLFV